MMSEALEDMYLLFSFILYIYAYDRSLLLLLPTRERNELYRAACFFPFLLLTTEEKCTLLLYEFNGVTISLEKKDNGEVQHRVHLVFPVFFQETCGSISK